MGKNLGLILIVAATIMSLWAASAIFNVSYWLLSPEQKFYKSWQADLALLEKSKTLPKQWSLIKELTIKAANAPAQDWIAINRPPIKLNPSANYRLDIFVIHWLEGYRYGVVIEYNLVDLRNENTIWELGRTLKLGWVY